MQAGGGRRPTSKVECWHRWKNVRRQGRKARSLREGPKLSCLQMNEGCERKQAATNLKHNHSSSSLVNSILSVPRRLARLFIDIPEAVVIGTSCHRLCLLLFGRIARHRFCLSRVAALGQWILGLLWKLVLNLHFRLWLFNCGLNWCLVGLRMQLP